MAWKDDVLCVIGSRSTQEEISNGNVPAEEALSARALFSSQAKC